MIISFFGHADIFYNEKIEHEVYLQINKIVNNEKVEFYLGGYGNFDALVKNCCLKYKTQFQNSKIYFITPYIYNSYLKNKENILHGYDKIIYPDLETCPLRFAITKRNRWIVENSDFIIFYVSHSWGGAYESLEYAKKKRKNFINIYKDF